ncbi:hypothetical protein GCM10009799_42320 [Nocardiopsis rhodophaea]|uniref:Uncharacterized protein n=1 Tax=Nocardiopsis rhodophaea TaxID=280238 RepID=A0ABN2THK1_9ACTN
MTTPITRVIHGDITVTHDPRLPLLQRFTVRGRGGRIIRLRAPRDEAHRALVRECGLTRNQSAHLLKTAEEGADQ